MQEAKRLPVLDALRGYAVLLVVITHISGAVIRMDEPQLRFGGLTLMLSMPFHNAAYAVQLFFLISGFVLYLPYANGRRQMQSLQDVLKYLGRRAARILPLFWLSVLVPTILLYGDRSWDAHIHEIVPLLTLTFPFIQDAFLPHYNFPLWSLGIEIWLSILLPLFILWVRKSGVRIPILSVLVLVLAWRLTALVTSTASNRYFLIGALPSQLDSFIFGVGLAHVYANSLVSHQYPTRTAALGFLIAYFGCTLTDSVAVQTIPFAAIALGMLVANIGFAMMVHGLLYTKSAALRAVVANPPIRQIGMMCYSIYVWHITVANGIFPKISNYPLAMTLFLVALPCVSVLSYRYIEFGHKSDARSLFVFPAWNKRTPPRQIAETAPALVAVE